MKFEYTGSFFRVVVELFAPDALDLRKYKVTPRCQAEDLRRGLMRRVNRRMKQEAV